MKRAILPLAGALLLCAVPTLQAQNPTESAHDLVKDVVYNELQERSHISLWQYRVDKRVASQTTLEQEVETVGGTVSRVLARQGKPLDQAAQKKETDRLNNLQRNPAEQARMKQEQQADEQRLERLISAMPDAFLYTYNGTADGNLRLSFEPNPTYSPRTYETRVYHALSGEILIQPQLKRLVKIDAHIVNQIDFGYGLLGRIEKGGTFQIGREKVGDGRWKTSLLDVHISGRVVFFRAISKDERVLRSAFQPVALQHHRAERRRPADSNNPTLMCQPRTLEAAEKVTFEGYGLQAVHTHLE